jgi:hypothetical protein
MRNICLGPQLRELISTGAPPSAVTSTAAAAQAAPVRAETAPSPGAKRVLLVTASAQLRTVVSALLRRFSPTVVPDFAAANETAVAAVGGGGEEEAFSAVVVDLELVAAASTAAGGSESAEDGSILRLRTALWGEARSGVVVGIAPAGHATAAQGPEALGWTQAAGIDKVLQRSVGPALCACFSPPTSLYEFTLRQRTAAICRNWPTVPSCQLPLVRGPLGPLSSVAC